METITINKAQLQAAYERWEQDHRDGKCRSHDEVAAMSVEQVAQESADALWNLLQPAPALDTASDAPLTGGTCEPGRPEGCESCQ